MGRAAAVMLALAVLALAAACGNGRGEATAAADEAPALVFAAASLSEPFAALEQAFEARHPEQRIELHLAGTPQLVVQIREGAPADVLAAADLVNMQRVVDAGQAAAPPVPFARNRLTIVTAPGNPHGIAGLVDLARADLRVALCGPEVPAGRYAREALGKAGVVLRPVSDEPSVKAIVSKLQLGEIDAGIVYVTDAASARGMVAAVPIPEAHDVVATYPIAVLSTGRARATGEAFVAFVLSEEGRGVLGEFGFLEP